MIKKLTTIFLIISAVVAVAVIRAKIPATDFVTEAKKVGDLTITGLTSPLFDVHNFLPGDISETKTVTITNGGSNPIPIGIRGEKTSSTDPNFTNYLYLNNPNTSLTNFFNTPGFTHLDNLPGLTTKTYQFQVHFDPNADNNFQNDQVIFNLSIGYDISIPDECVKIAKLPNVQYIFGTEKKETLTGGNYPNIIFGFGGDDVLNGNNQEDCLIGGDDNDKLHGNNKNDVLIGGSGNDDLFGGNGTDTCLEGESKKTCEKY